MPEPPNDQAAERAVLGALMLRWQDIDLAPEDFFSEQHRLCYRAIRAAKGDPVLAADQLRRRNLLERAGGAVYLHACLAEVPTAANLDHYVAIVARHAHARRLLVQIKQAEQALYDGADPSDVASDLHSLTFPRK